MKKNNIIKFNATVDVNVGDSLLVGIKEGVERIYIIDSIIEKRDSSMVGMKYYTAKRFIHQNSV
jgi:transcription elongation factor